MRLTRNFLFLSLAICVSVACKEGVERDLTVQVVGTYTGSVSLYLDTDSTQEIQGQRVEITKLDDRQVQIRPLQYPDSSPADSLNFIAQLTETPYGFIRTEGVMLTLDPVNTAEGSVVGTPYLVSGGGDREAHGRYDQGEGELVFALRVLQNGVETFELFLGNKD